MITHRKLTAFLALGLLCACGVKGRPVPPEKPAELGRGRPTFTRTTEDFRFRNIPPVETEKDTTTKKDDEDKP